MVLYSLKNRSCSHVGEALSVKVTPELELDCHINQIIRSATYIIGITFRRVVINSKC